MKKIALAIALIGSACCIPALAQTTEVNPSWYVAPSLNYTNSDNGFGLTKDGQGLGLRFGKMINPSWDLQLGGIAARTKQGSTKYTQNLLSIDALYLQSRQAVRPFLLFSVGGQHDKLSNALKTKSKSSPFVGAGIGLQAALTEQLTFQADVRRNMAYVSGNDYNFNRAYTTYASVGLNYFFDKVAKPAPVVAPTPAPTPVAEPAPAPVTPPPPAPKFEKYTLSSTELFAFDSAVLAPTQTKLDEIASALKASPSVSNVVISGFTDRLGSDQYNQKLSEKRATAVRDYLVNAGITSDRLNAVGKGEANPVVTCNNKKRADLIKCLEPNRRVEIEQMTFERRVN
jgi:OOP family OmpA-OmpF porin